MHARHGSAPDLPPRPFMCIAHVCENACVCMCSCVQGYAEARDLDGAAFSVTLVFVTSLLSDPGAHWLDWPWKPRDPPVPTLPPPCATEVLELHTDAAMPSL